MKVAGFTFIRNALLYDYPVVEAIKSILPVCDYFVAAVGKSEDATLDLVRDIGDPKIHIMETVWDDSLREGGRVLAQETDKAFDVIPPEYDWCFYIQADECVHESDLPAIQAGMERWLGDPRTEGLLFNYRHFYGSYDFIGVSRKWYRREVRIIRNDKRIRSFRDAQGFRLAPPGPPGGGERASRLSFWNMVEGEKASRLILSDKSTVSSLSERGEAMATSPSVHQNEKRATPSPPPGGAKLRVRLLPATIYHYGWVKHPALQQQKQLNFNRLWHSDDTVHKMTGTKETYEYDGAQPLERFTGTHPAVMQARINAMNWKFQGDPAQSRRSWKDRISHWLEQTTGWRPGEYKNYVLLRDEI